VSPSFIHEWLAERLGMFVMVVLEELEIPCRMAGGTTFRRRKKQAGVEGDKTFYLAHVGQILGKRDINLRTDPPPDLAIEAVHTHGVTTALEVYRRLRVPEVWVCDPVQLQILVRGARGHYASTESSQALPFPQAKEIFDRVTRPETASDTEWVRDLRRWVRDILVPRRSRGPSAS
jgi:Uma2 family endonuclease